MTDPQQPAPAGAFDDPATVRAFVQRLREGLYVADSEGRLLDASPALAALVGASDPAALRGRRLDELCSDPAARRAAFGALQPGGAPIDAQIQWRALDGSRRAVLESVAAVQGVGGATQLHGVVLPLAAAAEGEAAARARDTAEPERDALTGCLERTHLTALGERLARDPMTHVGVIVVRLESFDDPDLDRDDLRQLVARFLMRHVRGNEPVIRLGDDEFLVVLGGAQTEQVERVARRVQLLALRGAPGPLSLGWAAREHGESLTGVVGRASRMRVPVPTSDLAEDRRHREVAAGAGPATERRSASDRRSAMNPLGR